MPFCGRTMIRKTGPSARLRPSEPRRGHPRCNRPPSRTAPFPASKARVEERLGERRPEQNTHDHEQAVHDDPPNAAVDQVDHENVTAHRAGHGCAPLTAAPRDPSGGGRLHGRAATIGTWVFAPLGRSFLPSITRGRRLQSSPPRRGSEATVLPRRRGRLLQACQTVRSRTHPAAPPYPRNLFTSRRIFPMAL